MKLQINNFCKNTIPTYFGKLCILFLLLIFQFSFAQKKEEKIDTEVVNVVKPYRPTISDAFKIKEIPSLDDDGNTKKETIKYTIFSFPVASTFMPSKGKAEGVEKEKQEHLFDNYATFGGGNYGTLNAELFVTQNLDDNSYVAGMIRHLSSQGGIKKVELPDSFYDTSVDMTYGLRQSNLAWNLDLGYQNQIYNWYGLPQDFASSFSSNARTALINSINPQQTYNTIYIGSKIELQDQFFKEASVKFNHFSNVSGSSENRLVVKPTLEVKISDLAIRTNFIVDHLNGSFKKDYDTNNSIQYGFTNIGIAPSFVYLKEDWTLNIGAKLFYSNDTKNKSNKFLVYPQITASYKVVGDLMLFYAGAEGDLHQNTYAGFIDENPFLSPTLAITPTDKKYDLFAGLKGKIANNVSYNIRGSVVNENNKALFKSNDYNEDLNNESYANGNSMKIVYDDLKTVSFYGELKADFSDDLTFGIDGTFSSYTKKYQSEAWNLPAVKLNAKLNFNITDQWYAGVSAFYVGQRKDQKFNTYFLAPSPATLDGYFDLNAHLGYKYSNRLTAFLRGNNLTNKAYSKWLDYPVQGLQVVLGINYKFDF